MLRFVNGKPLGDISTEILNGQQEQTVRVLETPSPVREPEQPLPEVVTLVDPVVASLDDEEPVQHSPHQSPPPVEASTSSPPRNQFSPLPDIRPSFLSELFEDDLDNTANLDIRDQIGQVLRNQQVLFSLLSKVLGLVQGSGQPGRALSETRLPFGGESVQGGNQEEGILGNRLGGIQERELEPFASPQGSSSLLPEEDTDLLHGMDGVEDDIFYREIVKIKGQSCSMGNFATKLVQKFFHTSELNNRNCMGSRGKVPLQ